MERGPERKGSSRRQHSDYHDEGERRSLGNRSRRSERSSQSEVSRSRSSDRKLSDFERDQHSRSRHLKRRARHRSENSSGGEQTHVRESQGRHDRSRSGGSGRAGSTSSSNTWPSDDERNACDESKLMVRVKQKSQERARSSSRDTWESVPSVDCLVVDDGPDLRGKDERHKRPRRTDEDDYRRKYPRTDETSMVDHSWRERQRSHGDVPWEHYEQQDGGGQYPGPGDLGPPRPGRSEPWEHGQVPPRPHRDSDHSGYRNSGEPPYRYSPGRHPSYDRQRSGYRYESWEPSPFQEHLSRSGHSDRYRYHSKSPPYEDFGDAPESRRELNARHWRGQQRYRHGHKQNHYERDISPGRGYPGSFPDEQPREQRFTSERPVQYASPTRNPEFSRSPVREEYPLDSERPRRMRSLSPDRDLDREKDVTDVERLRLLQAWQEPTSPSVREPRLGHKDWEPGGPWQEGRRPFDRGRSGSRGHHHHHERKGSLRRYQRSDGDHLSEGDDQGRMAGGQSSGDISRHAGKKHWNSDERLARAGERQRLSDMGDRFSDRGIRLSEGRDRFSDGEDSLFDRGERHADRDRFSDGEERLFDRGERLSNRVDIRSDRGERHSDRGDMHSDGGDRHSDRGDMHSDRGDMHSDRGERHSDRGDRHSDRGDMHSDRAERHSDRGDRHSDRGDRHSDRGDRHSDRGDMHSDRGDRHSDRGERHSDRGDMHSDRGDRHFDRGERHSDRGDRHSDRGDMHSDRGDMHSDRGDRHSDRGDRHSDRGDRHSDKGEWHSDRGDKHSDRGDKHSDRGDRHSDRGTMLSEKGSDKGHKYSDRSEKLSDQDDRFLDNKERFSDRGDTSSALSDRSAERGVKSSDRSDKREGQVSDGRDPFSERDNQSSEQVERSGKRRSYDGDYVPHRGDLYQSGSVGYHDRSGYPERRPLGAGERLPIADNNHYSDKDERFQYQEPLPGGEESTSRDLDRVASWVSDERGMRLGECGTSSEQDRLHLGTESHRGSRVSDEGKSYQDSGGGEDGSLREQGNREDWQRDRSRPDHNYRGMRGAAEGRNDNMPGDKSRRERSVQGHREDDCDTQDGDVGAVESAGYHSSRSPVDREGKQATTGDTAFMLPDSTTSFEASPKQSHENQCASPIQSTAELRDTGVDSGSYSSPKTTVLSSQEQSVKEELTPSGMCNDSWSGGNYGARDEKISRRRSLEPQHSDEHENVACQRDDATSPFEVHSRPSESKESREKSYDRTRRKESCSERRSSLSSHERSEDQRNEDQRRPSHGRSAERQRSDSYGSHDDNRSERRRRESQRSSQSHRSPEKYSPERDHYRRSRRHSGDLNNYERDGWSPVNKIAVHFVPGMRCPVESCFQHVYNIQLQFDIHWKNVHYPEKERYTCKLCPGGPYDEDPAHFEDLEYHFSKHHHAIKMKLLDKGELETVLREIPVTNEMYSSPGHFSYKTPSDLQRILYMEPESLPADWPDHSYGPAPLDHGERPMPPSGPRGPPLHPRGPPGGPHGRLMGPYRPGMGPNGRPLRPCRPPFGPPMRPGRPRMGPHDHPGMPHRPPCPPGPRMRAEGPHMGGPRPGPPPDGPRMRPHGPPGPRFGPPRPPPRHDRPLQRPPLLGPRPRPMGPGPGPQMLPPGPGPRPPMGPRGFGPRPPFGHNGQGPRPPTSLEPRWPPSQTPGQYTPPPSHPSRSPFPSHSNPSSFAPSRPISAYDPTGYGTGSHNTGCHQAAMHLSQATTNYNQQASQAYYNTQQQPLLTSSPSTYNQPLPSSFNYNPPAMGYTPSPSGYYSQTATATPSCVSSLSQPPPMSPQQQPHPVASYQQPAVHHAAYTCQPSTVASYTHSTGDYTGQPTVPMSSYATSPATWSTTQLSGYSVPLTRSVAAIDTVAAYYTSSQATTSVVASTGSPPLSSHQEAAQSYDYSVSGHSTSAAQSHLDTSSLQPQEVPNSDLAQTSTTEEDNQNQPQERKKSRVKVHRLHFKPDMQCPVQGCDNVKTYHLKCDFDNHWREKHMSKGGSAYGHCKLCIQKGSIFTISLERQEALYQHFTKSHPHVNLKVNEPSSFISVKQKLDSSCIDPRPWQYTPGVLLSIAGKKKNSGSDSSCIPSSLQASERRVAPVLVCPENSCRNTGSFSSVLLFESHWRSMHLNEEFGPCTICLEKGVIDILTLMEMEDLEAHFSKLHRDVYMSGANQNSYIILGSEISGAGTTMELEEKPQGAGSSMSQAGTEVRIAWSKVVPDYIYLHYKRVCSNDMAMETVTGEDMKYFVIPPTAQFEFMDVQYYGSCRLCKTASQEENIAMHKDNISAHFKKCHSYIEIL